MDNFLVEMFKPFQGEPGLVLIMLCAMIGLVVMVFFKILEFIFWAIWKVFDYFYTPYLKRTNIDKYWEREHWKNIEFGLYEGIRIKDMNKFFEQPKVQAQMEAANKLFEKLKKEREI
jgi:hypothetical protein